MPCACSSTIRAGQSWVAAGDRMGDWRGGIGGVARDCPLANGTFEPGRAGGMLLAYREDPSFFAVSRALGVHQQRVQRCVERAPAYGRDGGARRFAHGRARSRRSPPRPRHGWSLSPAARPRTWAIPTNCGRRGFWLATRASTDPPKDKPPSASWLKARCARSSMSKR